jgi:hypothetical protein
VAQVPVAELGEALDADRCQLLVTPPKAWQPLLQGEQAAHPAADRRWATGTGRAGRRHRRQGGWELDAAEELVEPEDLRAALDAEPNARANWDGFPGSPSGPSWNGSSLPNAHRRVPAGSLRPPGWLPRASAPISGANQVAPSLNFPIRLQGNGDGATQHQRTVSMARSGRLVSQMRANARPARRAGQASLALFVVGPARETHRRV